LTVKQIFKQYRKCEYQLKLLTQELEILSRSPEFIKVTRYGDEERGGGTVEDIHLNILDKRRELETKIKNNQAYITLIDHICDSLKKEFNDDYSIFHSKYLKDETVTAIMIELGYANHSSIYRKLKKMEDYFEQLMQSTF